MVCFCLSAGRRVPCHRPAPRGRRPLWIQRNGVCLRPLRYRRGQHPEEGRGWWQGPLPDSTEPRLWAGLPGLCTPRLLSRSNQGRQVAQPAPKRELSLREGSGSPGSARASQHLRSCSLNTRITKGQGGMGPGPSLGRGGDGGPCSQQASRSTYCVPGCHKRDEQPDPHLSVLVEGVGRGCWAKDPLQGRCGDCRQTAWTP